MVWKTLKHSFRHLPVLRMWYYLVVCSHCISYLCGIPFFLNSLAGILGQSVLSHLVCLQFLTLIALCFLFLLHFVVTFVKNKFIFPFRYGILQCECGNLLDKVEMVIKWSLQQLCKFSYEVTSWQHVIWFVSISFIFILVHQWIQFSLFKGFSWIEMLHCHMQYLAHECHTIWQYYDQEFVSHY